MSITTALNTYIPVTEDTIVNDQPIDQSLPSPAYTRTQDAALRLDIEAQEIEQLPFDLSVLENDGIFINVDSKGFGMLDRRLDWSALGITIPKESAVAFHPPRIGVLPNKYRLPLQRPASQAHTALNKYGYRFRLTETLFQTPEYRWVCWQAFSQFEEEFNNAQQALNKAKANTLEHYDEILEQVHATFSQLAVDSARRLQATTAEPLPIDFHSRIVEGALKLIPSRKDIEEGLTLRFTPGVILLGSEMIAEQRRAAEQKRELAQLEAETDAIHAESRRKNHLEQMSILAEEERLRQQTRFQMEELERERATKERIRQLKIEAARERLNETLSPLTEGMQQLHLKIYEAAQAMRDTLQDARFVPGATARSARELSRWFKLMNFQNDSQLEQLLEELNTLASAHKSTRSPGDITEVLNDIVRATQKNARELLKRNRFDAIEV
jgi:hypothetical protein